MKHAWNRGFCLLKTGVICGSFKHCSYSSRDVFFIWLRFKNVHTFSRGILEYLITHFPLIKSLPTLYNKSQIAGGHVDVYLKRQINTLFFFIIWFSAFPHDNPSEIKYSLAYRLSITCPHWSLLLITLIFLICRNQCFLGDCILYTALMDLFILIQRILMYI